MTKEELMPLAKTYFDSDKTRLVIFGTEDKHFFNTEGDAKHYCKDSKEYYSFHKHDFDKPKPVKKVVKEEPKAEVKSEPAKVEAEKVEVKAEPAKVKTEPKKVTKKP
jgi:hypothetical protein